MSTVAVLTEARLFQDRGGTVWGRADFSAERFDIYRTVFDRVILIARVERADHSVAPGLVCVQAPGFEVLALPPFSGIAGLARQARAVNRAVWSGLRDADSLILRLPTTAGGLLYPSLARRRRPFGVEVLGDPGEFSRGVLEHPLLPILRRYSVLTTRTLTRRATTAVYVTERRLQQRFPAGPHAVAVGVTDTVVAPGWFADPDTVQSRSGPPYQLVTVASLEQPYKGISTLLAATQELLGAGHAVRLAVVGDGKLRETYEQEAQQLGIGGAVDFLGQRPAAQVREILGQADVFVLASLTEGLPKVLVEAMAAGLPCVATRVGGIPELLPEDCLVAPGDAQGLSERIWLHLGDPVGRRASARRNLETASLLLSKDVQAQRDRALITLRAATNRWSEAD